MDCVSSHCGSAWLSSPTGKGISLVPLRCLLKIPSDSPVHSRRDRKRSIQTGQARTGLSRSEGSQRSSSQDWSTELGWARLYGGEDRAAKGGSRYIQYVAKVVTGKRFRGETRNIAELSCDQQPGEGSPSALQRRAAPTSFPAEALVLSLFAQQPSSSALSFHCLSLACCSPPLI